MLMFGHWNNVWSHNTARPPAVSFQFYTGLPTVNFSALLRLASSYKRRHATVS